METTVVDPKKMTDSECSRIYHEAYQAGAAAAVALTPVPMIVGQAKSLMSNEIDETQKTYFVADGVCGFAWVTVYPGNSRFANWLKRMNIGRKAYEGGVSFSIHEYNQSMQKKEAHAFAAAEVLRKYGIKAHASSRMD